MIIMKRNCLQVLLASLLLIITSLQHVYVHGEEDFDETSCGVTKSCLLGGVVLLSWRNNVATSKVFFEMKGETDGYVAMALSADDRMGSDSVTECVKKSDGTVAVYQSYNEGHDNHRLNPPDVGLSDKDGIYNNGFIYCSFSRAHVHQEEQDFFEIKSDKLYYLLLAVGNVDKSDVKQQHRKDSVSKGKVDLTSDPGLVGSSSDTMLKAHACVLLSAWMLCASVSVIMARYYKAAWPDNTIFSLKVWFQVHRTLMILVLALHVIGIVVIFVDVEDYTDDAGETLMKVHPILGLIVTALVIINPIMSLFRCAPNSAKRPIFNWAHLMVGMSAHVLAVVTIFLGLKSIKSEEIVPDWIFYVMVGFVAFHLLTDVVLEINKCLTTRDQVKTTSSDMEMTAEDQTQAKTSRSRSHTFSYVVLGIYLLVAIAAWLTMVITIALE